MESRLNNTIVVIPSYNESRTIGSIVLEIVKMGLSVLVVDDGSIDSTEKVALNNGAIVISNTKNLGKGFSVRKGIKHVIDKTNFDWMIIMDGDGQHRTEDIKAFMSSTRKKEADIIIGNRMLHTKKMPLVRYLTNRFMSWVVSGMCGQRIPDTQCGYRLIKTSAIRELELTSDKYDIESEMLIEGAKKGLSMRSVPIQTVYGEEISKIKPIRDTLRFFSLILKYRSKPHGLRSSKKKDGR